MTEQKENPVVKAYKQAEQIVWQKLDDYQKVAIEEARKNPELDDHIAINFAKQIDLLVECELNENDNRYQHFVKKTKSRYCTK